MDSGQVYAVGVGALNSINSSGSKMVYKLLMMWFILLIVSQMSVGSIPWLDTVYFRGSCEWFSHSILRLVVQSSTPAIWPNAVLIYIFPLFLSSINAIHFAPGTLQVTQLLLFSIFGSDMFYYLINSGTRLTYYGILYIFWQPNLFIYV